MRGGTRYPVVAGLIGSALLGLGACTETNCTSIGSTDSVGIRLDPGAPTTGLSTIRACIAAQCAEQQVAAPFDQTWLDLDAVKQRPVSITVQGTGASGRTLFSGTVTVTPQRFEPNGPGCGTWWHANLKITAAGVATA